MPGAVLLGLDLAVEVGGHALELADHVLDVGDLARLLVSLEAFQPERRFACFHGSIPRTQTLNLNGLAPKNRAKGAKKVPSLASYRMLRSRVWQRGAVAAAAGRTALRTKSDMWPLSCGKATRSSFCRD